MGTVEAFTVEAGSGSYTIPEMLDKRSLVFFGELRTYLTPRLIRRAFSFLQVALQATYFNTKPGKIRIPWISSICLEFGSMG